MKRPEDPTWDAVWRDPLNQEDWSYLSSVILSTLLSLLPAGLPRPLAATEMGCGSGRITLALAERMPVTAVLLDESRVAVRRLAERLGSRPVARPGSLACVVRGDVFRPPLAAGAFDLAWNAGLLEHFGPTRQEEALAQMHRVLAPGGLLVTLNPYAGCLLHTLGKAFVERFVTYPYGEETPLRTLAPAAARLGLSLSGAEFSVGFLVLFVGMWKRLALLPGLRWAGAIYRLLNGLFAAVCRRPGPERLIRRLDLVLSRLFGGYLLVTSIRKGVSHADTAHKSPR